MLSFRPLLFIILIFFCGCKKFQQLDSQIHPEWLAPIAKTTVSLETLSLLDSTQFTRKIPSLDLGFPSGITLDLPALYFSHLGPYPLAVSDWVKEVHVQTLDLTISITNSFPITIGAGTVITIRNDNDTINNQNIVSQTPLLNDILPGRTFIFSIKLNDRIIDDTVFFYLDQFNSPAQNNVTFTNSPATITVGLNILSVELIEFYADRSKSIRDTSEFSIKKNTNTHPIDDSTIEGKLIVYIDNAFPLNSNFQVYFLDGSKRNVIDSLFDQGIYLQSATTDDNGSPTSITHSIDSVIISSGHLQKIKQAKFAVSSLEMNTINNKSIEISANNQTYLDIQIVGDLKMNFHL